MHFLKIMADMPLLGIYYLKCNFFNNVLHRPHHECINTSCYVLVEEGKSINQYGNMNTLITKKAFGIKF